MYVIFPAVDVVEESYFALVAQEQSEANPTGLTSTSHRSDLLELEVTSQEQQQHRPVFHDTKGEQLRAQRQLSITSNGDGNNNLRSGNPGLNGNYSPDSNNPTLLPITEDNEFALEDFHFEYYGLTQVDLKMAMSGRDPATGAPHFLVRDLTHPSLTEPLKQQQQSTFKLVKTGRTI